MTRRPEQDASSRSAGTDDEGPLSQDAEPPGAAALYATLLSPSGPMRQRPPRELVRMRDARDQVLATTVKGRRYLRMVEDHGGELIAILIADAKVAALFQSTLDQILAETDGQRHDDPRISEISARRIVDVIDLVAPRASAAFGHELKLLRREFEGRRGVSLRELIA